MLPMLLWFSYCVFVSFCYLPKSNPRPATAQACKLQRSEGCVQYHMKCSTTYMKHHIRMLCAHMCVSTGMWGRTLLAIDQHVYVCSPTTIIEQENPKQSGMRVGHTVLENNRPSTILKTILYQQEKRIAQT